MSGYDQAPPGRRLEVLLGPERLALVLCAIVGIGIVLAFRGGVAGTRQDPTPTVSPVAPLSVVIVSASTPAWSRGWLVPVT